MTQTQPEEKLEELVVYYLVDMYFEIANMYTIGGGGLKPNARYIAQQYGCYLEFRESRLRKTGPMDSFPSYLERHGIMGSDGSCVSAVLIGEDKEKLMKARDDIRRTFGFTGFAGGFVDVGREKTFLSK